MGRFDSALTKQTYRHVLRAIRSREDRPFEILSEVNPHLWGNGSYLDVAVLKERRRKMLDKYEIPYTESVLSARSIEKDELLNWTRSLFRSENENISPASMFSTLRFFEEQKILKQRQSVKTTRNIRCTVRTDFIGMSEDDQHHVFAYNVVLENLGHEQVKLHGRHLIFEDSNPDVSHIEVPRGSPGVVGLTPLLGPGTIFEYGSGAHLQSDSGFMSGSFQLATEQGETFDAFMGPVSLLPN